MVGALPSLRKSSIVANVSVPREDVWQEPIGGDVVVSESADKRSNIYQTDRQTNIQRHLEVAWEKTLLYGVEN